MCTFVSECHLMFLWATWLLMNVYFCLRFQFCKHIMFSLGAVLSRLSANEEGSKREP